MLQIRTNKEDFLGKINISLPDLRWVAISLIFDETFLLQFFRIDILLKIVRDLNIFEGNDLNFPNRVYIQNYTLGNMYLS